jgi:hypothetical protein
LVTAAKERQDCGRICGQIDQSKDNIIAFSVESGDKSSNKNEV